MKTVRCFLVLISFLFCLLLSFSIFAEGQITATKFHSNGDEISGWYWLRDISLLDFAEWEFDTLPGNADSLVLKVSALATNTMSGGRGFDADFTLYSGSSAQSQLKSLKVHLFNISTPNDPVGYICQGEVTIPREDLQGGSHLFLRVKRTQSTSNHVAFNQESFVLLGAGCGDESIEKIGNKLESIPGTLEEKIALYTVTITTGTVDGAGTDANVFITLYGENSKQTGECQLDGPENDFENGQIDIFNLLGPRVIDVGNITRVNLRHDNSGEKAGWYVTEVRIKNNNTGYEWVYPVNRWLAVDEDDHQISIDIP